MRKNFSHVENFYSDEMVHFYNKGFHEIYSNIVTLQCNRAVFSKSIIDKKTILKVVFKEGSKRQNLVSLTKNLDKIKIKFPLPC
jgi:hypothetical protein